ncbi:sugar ABC transporter substrate-binding protein [Oceanicola granulosus HTCC2516]|uniref:Sugar ABC transporter substrate-binding protein n=1 Tax=Oceanicola granulosus (strain ATCC BAA-861 / DSM 15982 / KCTC 12143 / HTCC2516) TaxID=314256 RepID=Q2CEE6_OCEGH|nr:extracellular solute-binding protein [Oceanicola granulosus]EAR51051.1 sugar ABC transporter substrate-binding protein [Oceanicola granulosus HTCC2516]
MTTTFRLLGATALTLIAAAASAQTEIRFTHSMTSGGNAAAMDAIVAAFEEANPDITVRQITFDDDVYSDTGLITQLQSNEVPDIYFQWAGFPLARDVEAGYAMNLSEAMADGWADTFIDSAFSSGAGTTVDGDIYMVPLSLDVTNTIWYNTAILEEYDLEAPETWDEFLTVIGTLAEAGETPIVTGNNELWPLGNWASHVAARVVPMADFDAAFRQEKTFADAGFRRPLELMQELHEAGAFNRDMQGLGADPAMAAFFQEAAVMHPIGSWLVGSAGEMAEEGFAYSQFDTPVIDDAAEAPRSAIGTLTGLVVHAQSANPDAAITFLEFLSSPEMQTIWAEGGALSPVAGVEAEIDPQLQAMSDLLANADAMVPPPDTTYPVPVAEAYYQAAAYAASGEKTAEGALTWLDETVAAMGQQ